MPLLLKACPSFQASWNIFLQQGDTRLVYIPLGVFVHHLLHCHLQGDEREFTAVADAIEQLYLHGTDYVKEAVTGGLLEAVQNIWRHHNADPEHFATYLKPVSAKWWQSLNDFWDE